MNLSSFQKGLVIVLVAMLFLGGVIFVNHIWRGDAFNKEEAQHALYGLWLTKDLKSLDLRSFWFDTQRQMFWPFLHSWVLSLFFLVFGINYVAARLMSLLFFFATLILMYLIATKFSEKSGWKIGMLSALLALTSPIMVRYAAENTLESLGALIFMASYYFYDVCEERKVAVYYVFLALLVGLSIYTNYLYAYLIIPGFLIVGIGKLGPVLAEVAHLNRKGEKAALPFLWWAYRKLIFLMVLLAVAGAWFFTAAFSRKFMLMQNAIFRFTGGEAQVGGVLETLLYYPKTIIENYAFSPWLGVLMVFSLLLPAVAFRYREANKLYTFCWTAIVLATLTIPTKAPQFIYIIAPFIFILFSAAVFYVAEDLKKLRWILLVVVFVPALLSLPRLAPLYVPSRPAENMISVLDYFHREVMPRYPVASSISLQRLSPEVVSFHFWDWIAPVLTDPAIGEDGMLREAKYMLTIELDPKSPYRADIMDDSIYRWNALLMEKLGKGELRPYSIRRFGSIGVTARIYEKVTPAGESF
jgi:hypothetical protein